MKAIFFAILVIVCVFYYKFTLDRPANACADSYLINETGKKCITDWRVDE